MKEWSKANIEKMKLYALGLSMIAVGIFVLSVVDDVTYLRKAAILVDMFGPQGALWVFRIGIFVVLFLLPAAMFLLSWYHDPHYDRFVRQKYELDNSIRENRERSE
jgi:hypothetical protein